MIYHCSNRPIYHFPKALISNVLVIKFAPNDTMTLFHPEIKLGEKARRCASQLPLLYFYFVTLNQSASIQPRFVFCPSSKAAKPIFAPIHLPSRILKTLPTLMNFFPSKL